MEIIGIMTCYNRKDKTIESIDRLILGNPGHSFKFIVVDDNSNDGTAELLSEKKNVVVLKGNGNLFYSGGMRKGIQFVKDNNLKAQYVLFFNDDVEFYDNIIDRMIEISDSGTNIVVGATEDSNGKMSYGGVIKNSKIKPSFRVVMSGAEKIYCDTFCANCVLIPYIVFSRLDNIDNKYVHSLGDYDYGLTATKKGYKIVATDFFVGCCNDNPVSQGWRDNTKPRKERIKLKEQPKGLPRKIWFYFIKKHYGFFSAVIYSITPYIRILFKK